MIFMIDFVEVAFAFLRSKGEWKSQEEKENVGRHCMHRANRTNKKILIVFPTPRTSKKTTHIMAITYQATNWKKTDKMQYDTHLYFCIMCDKC